MNPISKNNMKYNGISNIKIYKEFESSVEHLQKNQKDKLCNLLAVLKVILTPHYSRLSNQNSNSSNFKFNMGFTEKWQLDLENINNAVALIFGRENAEDTVITSYTNIILSFFTLESDLFNNKMLFSSKAEETLKSMQILPNEATIKNIEKALDDNLKTKLDSTSFNNLLAVLVNKFSSWELSILEYFAKPKEAVLNERGEDTQNSNQSLLNNVKSKPNDSIVLNFEDISKMKDSNNSDIESLFEDKSELENLVLLFESNNSQDNRLNIPANPNNNSRNINLEHNNKEESFVHIENKKESFDSDDNLISFNMSALNKNSKISKKPQKQNENDFLESFII